MNSSLTVFLDTNILLHYPPLDQINWPDICNAKEVKLVICLQVVTELDDKQSDPRLGERARRAIKEIRNYTQSDDPIREGVKVMNYMDYVEPDDFPEKLSSSRPDDCIFAQAKKYADDHPQEQICIYTEDYGMELRDGLVGISVLRMPNDHRLPNPGDELAKKNQALKQEVRTLKSQHPKFSAFVIPENYQGGAEEGQCAFKLLKSPPPVVDVEEEIKKKKEENPEISATSFNAKMQNEGADYIPDSEFARYAKERENYFQSYRRYLHFLKEWKTTRPRSLVFSVRIENSGGKPAEGVSAILELPASFLAVRDASEMRENEANLSEGYELSSPSLTEPPRPRPPRNPMNRSELAKSQSISRGMLLAKRQEMAFPNVIGPKESDVIVRGGPEHGHQIEFLQNRIPHNHWVQVGEIYAFFKSWDQVREFNANLSIYADNHPDITKLNILFNVSYSEGE